MTSEQQHVEIVQTGQDPAVTPQVLWSPVVGTETTRLLDDSSLDDEAQGSVVTQAVEVLERCADPAASLGTTAPDSSSATCRAARRCRSPR